MRAWIDEYDNDHDVVIHAAQKSDLDILADHCKALHNAGAGNGKDEKLAMRADGWTIMDWCNRKGVSWQQFWSGSDAKQLQERFIEDPDNAAFRVWKGKL